MSSQAKKRKISTDISGRHERRVIGNAANNILKEFSNDISGNETFLPPDSVDDQNTVVASVMTLSDSDGLAGISYFNTGQDNSSESSDIMSSVSTDIGEATIPDLADELVGWSKRNNISNTAVTDLLHILKPHISGLPLDSRSLLHTPRSVDVQNCSGGSYVYFGVKENILKKASMGLVKGFYPIIEKIQTANSMNEILTVTVNVDGLPLHSSSNKSFWPLLGILDQSVDKTPFIIAIYYGKSKPNDANDFFSSFVSECSTLEEQGIQLQGKQYGFRISCFVADAPARAFLKCIVSHNSLYACEKCILEGTYLGRTTWQYVPDLILRTDEAFHNQIYEDHQRCLSVITNLSVGLVSQVPLDWMHLICLGVVKKLLRVWVEKGPKKAKLNSFTIQQISERLVFVSQYTPREFCRKMRSLGHFKFWKATEFRAFILYFGPIVLQNLLQEHLYEHFLTLHVAIYILASNHFSREDQWRNFANQLLHTFVRYTGEYYTKELLVYNFHNLLHVADDVANFGSLDNYSAFPFENFMKSIKRMVRGPNNCLQQVAKRLGEKSGKNKPIRKKYHIIYGKGKTIKSVPLTGNDQCCIGIESPDNCFFTKDGLIIVINLIEEDPVLANVYKLGCKIFQSKTALFQSPLPSSRLEIFRVERLVNGGKISSTRLHRKCILIPDFQDNNVFICIPFCNMNLLY